MPEKKGAPSGKFSEILGSQPRQFSAELPDPKNPKAMEKLVADLSAVRVQQPDGTFQLSKGLYVEPLQLQVVCRGL